MTEQQIDKTLRDIYSRVPKEWRANAVTAKPMTPSMQLVVDKAMEDANFPTEKKLQLQALKDAGYFSKEKLIENPDIIKKIDNFVNREINKAVKEGRLPNKKKLAELKQLWQKEKSKK